MGYLKHGGLPRQTLLIYSGTPVLCPRPEIPQQAVKDSNLDASTQKIIENRTPRLFTVQVEVAQKRKVRSCCLNKYTLDASPVLVKLCRCQLPRAAFVEQDYPWSEYYSQFFEMQLWLALDAHCSYLLILGIRISSIDSTQSEPGWVGRVLLLLKNLCFDKENASKAEQKQKLQRRKADLKRSTKTKTNCSKNM